MSAVHLHQIAKSFDGTHQVLDGVSLQIEAGEFVVFVGPSGSGKSTLLRMIAGLESLSGGEIRIGERRVNDVHASQRGIAMVFQSYALYPHMTVYDNMAFSLRMAGKSKREVAQRVQRSAEILQITHLLERQPKALSGGQRQRVAIGRAIVREPQVFLFDEPLSNLDAALRQTMRVELSKLHRELGTTMIYVTHDQVEAMTLADRIVVFDGGIVQQVGTPAALYERPANLFVAGFLGAPRINLLPAALLAHAQGAATVGVRPEHWQIVGADGPDDDALDTRVELVEYLGDHRLVYLRMAGLRDALCLKQAHAAAPLQPGDAVRVRVPREHTLQFDAAGRALS